MLGSGINYVEVYSEKEYTVMALDGVVCKSETPFQTLEIVDSAHYGRSLILDGSWQSSSNDEAMYHEALVHPACIAAAALGGTDSPTSVLVLGGGEGATVREALRWPGVERVVMVDLDRAVVDACREHMPEFADGAFEDPRVEVVYGDALAYLRDASSADADLFDVIIHDLSDPIDEGPSQALFTTQTFQAAGRILAPNGVFALQSGMITPFLDLHVKTYSTLRASFASIASYGTFIPSFRSLWGFCMGSNAPNAQSVWDSLADTQTVDAILEKAGLSQALITLDGEHLRGMISHPKWLRQAYQAETTVFSSESSTAPPTAAPTSDTPQDPVSDPGVSAPSYASETNKSDVTNLLKRSTQ